MIPIEEYEQDTNIYWVIAQCGHSVLKVVGDRIEPCKSCQGLRNGADKQVLPNISPMYLLHARVAECNYCSNIAASAVTLMGFNLNSNYLEFLIALQNNYPLPKLSEEGKMHYMVDSYYCCCRD